jgi:hypothetical protein
VNKPLRRLITALSLTAAALTIPTLTVQPADTAWGAPAGVEDTAWGTPPTDEDSDGSDETPVVTQDTAWG